MYLNKAFVFGNLARDPELKSLPSGVNVSTFAIATNRYYRDKDGNRQEDTQFHNIVVFGRQAENVSNYLKKGSSAFVEGRLQTRSWESEGVKKYRTEIVADNVQFGPKGTGSGGGQSSQSSQGNSTGSQQSEGGEESGEDSSQQINYPDNEGINPEDIPF